MLYARSGARWTMELLAEHVSSHMTECRRRTNRTQSGVVAIFWPIIRGNAEVGSLALLCPSSL